jgi:hypothetical protein
VKLRVFILTKNEQRVVVLLILALLAGALGRYWRELISHPSPNKVEMLQPTAAPLLSPEDEVQPNLDRIPTPGATINRQIPSPHSSP